MGRPSKHDGVIYRRRDSKVWWMRYRDSSGTRRLESTNTEDWDEAQRRMRERLRSRDSRPLEVVRRGEQILFQDWVQRSWKITPSHRFVRQRLTRQTNAQ